MFKKHISLLFIIVLLILLFLTLGCREDITHEDIDIIGDEREVEPTGRMVLSNIETASISSPVQVGEIIWQINSAEDRGEGIIYDEIIFESIAGKIIVLDFDILNTSEEERVLYDLNLIDSRGRVFSICLPAYRSLSSEKACALQEIVPLVEYDFIAPFDVAPDSEGLILEVTDLKTPAEEKAYIDLGI